MRYSIELLKADILDELDSIGNPIFFRAVKPRSIKLRSNFIT